MKKKLIPIILCGAVMLSLSACGGNTDSKENSEGTTSEVTTTNETTTEATETNENVETYKIGDSVETDILKVTLINAELTIKMNSSGTATYEEMKKGISHIGEDYFTADEYNPDEDKRAAYVASKGHTFVAIEYKVENLDRGSVEVDDSFDRKFLSVEYNGETYINETKYGASSADGNKWERYNMANVLLMAGESGYYRCYVDIPIDVDNLSDDFYLTFHLPNPDESRSDFRFLAGKTQK